MRLNQTITHFEKLREYAFWYYGRYCCSRKKLRFALSKKCRDSELIENVMNVLEPYIQEQTSLESLARSYFENRKDVPYVRTKLREKLFESEDIESMLSNLASEYEDFERYEMVLNHKIEDGMAKGKSMRKVEMELTAAYPSFKSQVIELVKRVYVDEVEVLKSCHEKSLHTYHQADRKTKHKIVASLYSKWFSMESIKRFLSAQDDEESE